jgi:cystathionine beta-synthase
MVILLPDHGTRYLNKIYNDDWMKNHGFLESRDFATARDIIQSKDGKDQLVTIPKSMKVNEAVRMLTKSGISQIPVTDGEQIVGSLVDSKILSQLIENPEIKDHPVSELMDPAFKFVGMDNTLDVLSSLIDKENKALLVRDDYNRVHIITQADLLTAMTS